MFSAALFRRFFILLLVPLAAAGCSGQGGNSAAPQPDFPVPPRISEEEAVSFIRDDFSISPGFSSHLPLVVIDTKGEMVLPSHVWDPDRGYAVPIPGAKPYVKADIAIINSDYRANRLDDLPEFSSPAQIRYSGDVLNPDIKGQYRINLLDKADRPREAPVLGMESGGEWELVASLRDKSLLRNYLAYTMAAELLPFSPDLRFCEVVFKIRDMYLYWGVFLLAETVKPGPGRVPVSPGGEGENQGFIIRRDVYDPEEVALDTYATREGLSTGFLNLVYPYENVTGHILTGIEDYISRVERILYSESPVVYVNYTSYLDVNSFADYFLLSEYFMNFEAGFTSVYMFRDRGGRIRAGPIWNNVGSFDNHSEPLDPRRIGFFTAPWFNRMIRDLFFLKKLESRYSALRRTVLADETVIRRIDETARWLEPARQRDWKRWGYAYGGTYSQELVKMKYILTEHGAAIGNAIRVMTWERQLFDSSYSNGRSSLLAAGFVVLFFLSVHFGRHH
ncbi:MAG: CotH kinase family protein [Treponema sp.]|nr:CotH kinase family protein [Treponema sp.]